MTNDVSPILTSIMTATLHCGVVFSTRMCRNLEKKLLDMDPHTKEVLHTTPAFGRIDLLMVTYKDEFNNTFTVPVNLIDIC